jgi:hypothetical protein
MRLSTHTHDHDESILADTSNSTHAPRLLLVCLLLMLELLLLLLLHRTVEQRKQYDKWSSFHKDAYNEVRSTTPDPSGKMR